MPYYVYPSKDTIHIGDTIWLEARIPFVMKDFETGEYANYKNVDFNSEFYIYNLSDTTKHIFNQPEPLYATNNFDIIAQTGNVFDMGEVLSISYSTRNDSFFFKAAVIPKVSGFFSLNLAYNPGSGAHGRQVIDMGDKKCTHKLNTLCQSINDGSSTLQRAKDKGFKVWISPQPTKLEYWVYDNRMYFFTVVP